MWDKDEKVSVYSFVLQHSFVYVLLGAAVLLAAAVFYKLRLESILLKLY